jgi:hypothetical protein
MWCVTPEDHELQHKVEEYESLRREIDRKRQSLHRLRDELVVFEETCRHLIGSRFSRLGEIQGMIGEHLRRAAPGHRSFNRRRESHPPPASPDPRAAPGSPAAGGEAQPAKRYFRRIAIMAHPDLAADADDRARRTAIMVEANRAYREEDTGRLKEILQRLVTDPEAVPGQGVAADLVRTIRRIALCREDLRRVEAELTALRESQMGRLKEAMDEAGRQGRDVMVELSLLLDDQISLAAGRLEKLRVR